MRVLSSTRVFRTRIASCRFRVGEATQLRLLNEVQQVYRTQGVNIADKHFEVIIRQNARSRGD